MAYYKLFYIVHRRTDWNRLLRLERLYMMPEWYEEREKQNQTALKKLSFMTAMVTSLNSAYQNI